jgi:hypothetical protein
MGTAMLTPPFDAGPMVIVAGNGQFGLVSAGVMLGLGLDAHGQRHRRGIDARLGGDRPRRLQLEPQRRQAGAACALQRNRAAGFRPLLARILLEGRIVFHPRLRRGELFGDLLVDHGLDLRGHVDARAGGVQAGIAEIHLSSEIGLDAPVGGKARARGDDHIAPDLAADIEVLDVDAADLLGGVGAEQTTDRVIDRAGRL